MDDCPRYYEYSPLATQNVRLLNIRPGTGRFGGEGKIEIELTHHELGTTDFDALSYTWGPSTLEEEDEAAQQIFTIVARCYPIFYDDKMILVTKSLRDKLRRLRQLDDPDVKAYMASEMEFQKLKHLWVDGICINQDDSLERGRQVAMMARIYSTATTVLVDLGEADEEAKVGLQLAMKLGKLYKKLSETNKVDLELPPKTIPIQLPSTGILAWTRHDGPDSARMVELGDSSQSHLVLKDLGVARGAAGEP
jgi:hypothetical protein